MDLDPRICSHARLSRDARFDGRLFIGVRSTRIYCRSICPVRKVKETNVRYFPSAAAAADAGYRPCLRCRPELSPDTPAWSGTCTTVSRALRLISESKMEGEKVDLLASRLGVGSRQLRRLFVRHLGANPISVMKTRRLQFAKKLIDETNLPMDQIAIASGFGSVRRFNAAFRKTYNRTPSQLRRHGQLSSMHLENEYLFRLEFRPPFHWKALLNYLAQCAIPGVEAIEQSCYRRTISLNEHSGSICVSFDESDSAVQVGISFPEPRWLFLIIERVRRMFDLAADPCEISARLKTDPMLASLIQVMPGLHVPACWDSFELAVMAILSQQLSVRAANTMARRLVETFGNTSKQSGRLTHLFPTPADLAEANLTSICLPEKSAETIRSLARAIKDGQICFGSATDPDEFRLRLREVPGIEDWTTEYIAMRALGDPDAFPSSDPHLLYRTSSRSQRDLMRLAESWRPWRAYASMYLWQAELQLEKQEQRSTVHWGAALSSMDQGV